MKKFILFFALCFTLAGCGKSERDLADDAIRQSLVSPSSYDAVSYSKLEPLRSEYELEGYAYKVVDQYRVYEKMGMHGPDAQKAERAYLDAKNSYQTYPIGWLMSVSYSYLNESGVRLNGCTDVYLSPEKTRAYVGLDGLRQLQSDVEFGRVK